MINLKGLYVAMVTPFRDDGKLDEKGFTQNIDFLVERGVSGIVPCGTTGESPTLSWDEHMHVVDLAVAGASGRCQVIAGAGSNNTLEAVLAAKHARDAGADAALVITPYYNKPTQEGLRLHFERVAGESGIPMVLYNVPGRTGVNLLPATLEKLCDIENVVAVKEASGNITQMADIRNRCGDRLALLSGDDAMTLPVLSVGGMGVISVVGNIAPREMSEAIRLWFSGDVEGSRAAFFRLLNLCDAMFCETNPIPVKTAMNLLGFPSGELRLPLASLHSDNRARLEKVLREFGFEV